MCEQVIALPLDSRVLLQIKDFIVDCELGNFHYIYMSQNFHHCALFLSTRSRDICLNPVSFLSDDLSCFLTSVVTQ